MGPRKFAKLRTLTTGREPFEAAAPTKIQSIALGQYLKIWPTNRARFHHWKAKYGGLEVNEARRLSQLEDDNGRLK
jgi:hypothetical protein